MLGITVKSRKNPVCTTEVRRIPKIHRVVNDKIMKRMLQYATYAVTGIYCM